MSKQALDLDPLAARILGHNTWNQAWARNLSEAISMGQRVVDLHPEAGACCGSYLIMAYEQAGDYERAIRARETSGTKLEPELRRSLRKKALEGTGKRF